MINLERMIEATIDAISVDANNNVVTIDLTCAWENQDRLQIIALGVNDFLVNEMRISNIIDRVNVFDAKRLDENQAMTSTLLFYLMRGREPNNEDLEWPKLKEKMEMVRKSNLKIMEILPVYGASIIILAGDFRFAPEQQPA